MKKHDCDNRCRKQVIWIFFIELYSIKLKNRKKRQPYYMIEITSYNEKCEGHKFVQALENCT